MKIEDFNFHKFIIALCGMIFIIISLFSKDWTLYIISNFFGWLLVAYAIALTKNSIDMFDINHDRLIKIGMSYTLMIVGSILMRYYDLHKTFKPSTRMVDDNFVILLFGIILYIISKALLIVVELNLHSMSQYMTIISLSMLIMAKILNTISVTDTQFYVSIVYYILCFTISIFNISYNPIDKTDT